MRELHCENSRAVLSKVQDVPVKLNSLHMCPSKCQYVTLLMCNTKKTPRKLQKVAIINIYLHIM